MIRPSSPLLILTIAFALACGGGEAEEPAQASAPALEAETQNVAASRVEVAALEPSTLTLRTRWPGEVVGSEDAMLASATGGFIERVLVEEGDEVREGQTLIRVDTRTASARVAQARVAVDAANREYERAQRLGDAISAQQRDNAESQLSAARAQLRVASAASRLATIRAPFSGVVARLDADAGEVAGPGMPLLRLVKLAPVHVLISVPDRDVGALRPGQNVNVFVEASLEPVQASILRISPAANIQTRTFEARIEVANEDRTLLPGMIAQVQLAEEAEQAALIVPQHVLVTGLDENGVFIIDDEDTARWRPVQTGRVMRNQVVIESGISAGDRLVVTGHRELADGDALIVAREGTCCTAGRITFDQGASPPSEAAEETPEEAPETQGEATAP